MMTFPTISAGTRANEAIGGYDDFVEYLNALAAGVDTVTTTAAGAALKANNLTDLTDAAAARTALGLGTAAVVDTGTGASNVILGNDSRLTDTRTPTTHTHAQSDVTDLTTDLAARKQSLKGIAGSGTVWVPGQSQGSGSVSGLYNYVNLSPFYVPEAVTIASVSVNVTTLGTGVLRLGCYAHDATTGYPTGAPLWDAGTVSITGTGIKTASVSYTFAPGWYWQAWCWQSDGTTPAVFTGGGTTTAPSGIFPVRLSSNAAFTGNGAYITGGASGALPTIGSVSSQSAGWPRFTFTNA